MYICVCNGITERDIGGAVAQGCCTLRELRDQLGVGVGCGRCARCARDVLKDTLDTHMPANPAIVQHAAA
jgi:bacterioferritin-associated ferredoxin